MASMGSPRHDMDEMLRTLGPAPRPWVARAEELPRLERALKALTARDATSDEAAMQAALRDVGLEPDEDRLRALARLNRMR